PVEQRRGIGGPKPRVAGRLPREQILEGASVHGRQLSSAVLREAVLAQLLVQRRGRDAQRARRVDAIARQLRQRLLDGGALQRVQRVAGQRQALEHRLFGGWLG